MGPRLSDPQKVIRVTNALWATVILDDPEKLEAVKFLRPDAQLSTPIEFGIDFELSNISKYTPFNVAMNGLRPDGDLAAINLRVGTSFILRKAMKVSCCLDQACTQYACPAGTCTSSSHDNWSGEYACASEGMANLADFIPGLTLISELFDFDSSVGSSVIETISVEGYESRQYMQPSASHSSVVVDASNSYVEVVQESTLPYPDTYTGPPLYIGKFSATREGTGSDNPGNHDDLTELQAESAMQFTFPFVRGYVDMLVNFSSTHDTTLADFAYGRVMSFWSSMTAPLADCSVPPPAASPPSPPNLPFPGTWSGEAPPPPPKYDPFILDPSVPDSWFLIPSPPPPPPPGAIVSTSTATSTTSSPVIPSSAIATATATGSATGATTTPRGSGSTTGDGDTIPTTTTGGTATATSGGSATSTATTTPNGPVLLPPTELGTVPPPPPPASTTSRIDETPIGPTDEGGLPPTATTGGTSTSDSGDCAYSTYGCCPGEDVAKEDALGSNCRSRPGTSCRFSHFGCCPYVDEDRVDSAGTNCAVGPPPPPISATASSPPPPPTASGAAPPPAPPPPPTLDVESNISSDDDSSVPIWPFVVIPLAVLLCGAFLWYATAAWLKKQAAAEDGKTADV